MMSVVRSICVVGAAGAMLALAGCDGGRGGTYACDDHVDSSVEKIELSGGRIKLTNYHVPGDAPSGPYKVRDGKLTAEVNGQPLEGEFGPDGALTVNGLTCKKT